MHLLATCRALRWPGSRVCFLCRGEEEVVTEVRSSQRTVKLHNIMMQLRKCCSHPFLLEHPIDRATGELVVDESVVSRSGKMVLLDRMLDALRRRNHKVRLAAVRLSQLA